MEARSERVLFVVHGAFIDNVDNLNKEHRATRLAFYHFATRDSLRRTGLVIEILALVNKSTFVLHSSVIQGALLNTKQYQIHSALIRPDPISSIMSGIPVYTQSPINAVKASGTTPQTTTPQGQTSPSNPIPATMTSAASSSPTYKTAQPGAASVPGPTAAPQVLQLPLLPTPTTREETIDNPPHPQPGSLPTPASTRNIPAPPKAGERYRPQETGAPSVGIPYQMGIPPPTQYGVQPPRSSTSTATTAAASYPVALPSVEPRRSLEHPPNYQQNVYASELSSANTSGAGAQDTSENVGGNFLNTAKKWVEQAGEKLSEAEAEVWRRISKEQ